MTTMPKGPLQMVMLASKGTALPKLGSKAGPVLAMPSGTTSFGQSGSMVNAQGPNLQMVTLIAKGGTPVTLADQTGAPFPTTGSGALVFADNPVLNDAVFTGRLAIDGLLPQPGNVAVPAIACVNDPDTGIYWPSEGTMSVSSDGVQMFDVTPTGIVVHGDITYNGQLHGAYHDPLTSQGDIYYYGPTGSARLPLGPAGTVLTSNGSNLIYSTPPSGLVIGSSPIGAGTTGRVLFDDVGVVGEYPITGTAGNVVMSNGPAINNATLTGTPVAPLAAPGTNTNQVASTQFVTTAIAAIPPVDLSAYATQAWVTAQGYATQTWVTNQGYAPLASPIFTGDPQAPTPATTDNDQSLATTAFVRNAIAAYSPPPNLSGYAPLASPIFTGDPQAPTPATADNDNSIATTSFVKAAIAAGGGGTSISVGVTPPASPGPNALWFYTDGSPGGGQLYVWYNDGNTTQWVPSTGIPGPQGATGPQGPASGGVATPTLDKSSTLQSDGSVTTANSDVPLAITQGQSIYSRTFTAVDPSHPIEVDATCSIGNGSGAGTNVVLALFIDGGANAVAQVQGVVGSTWMMPFRLYWQGVLPTGPHTFQLRFGGNAANAWLNGNGSGVHVGGSAMQTWMKVSEIGVGPVGPPGPSGNFLQYKYKECAVRALLTGTYATAAPGTPTTAGGTALDSITVTPQSATSVLEIEGSFKGAAYNTAATVVIALFNGSTFVDQVFQYCSNGVGISNVIPFKTVMPSPGAGVPITLNFRVGTNGGTTWGQGMNNNTSFVANPDLHSWMSVRELLASP